MTAARRLVEKDRTRREVKGLKFENWVERAEVEMCIQQER